MNLIPSFCSSTIIFSEDFIELYNGGMRQSHRWQKSRRRKTMRVEDWEGKGEVIGKKTKNKKKTNSARKSSS